MSRNFTHSSNFLFGSTLFGEESTYAIQSCNLPGLSLGHIQASKGSVNFYLQGDTIEYNSLSIDIILDEGLKTWTELYNGMIKMREPSEGVGVEHKGDSWLTLQDDNSKTNIKLVFKDCRIESFGDIEFNTTTEDEILVLPVSVVYDYYTASAV